MVAGTTGPATGDRSCGIETQAVKTKMCIRDRLYTFRPENYFLPREFRNGDAVTARNTAGSIRQMRGYIAAGIDALFADDPATARQAVDGD